jgi:hypothetical protein
MEVLKSALANAGYAERQARAAERQAKRGG